MKKFSELVKKLTVVGNDYVPIIDSQAESDADKNKAALFSTILTYLRGETIRNTGTVTDAGMYALDAKQGNPNVAGSLASVKKGVFGNFVLADGTDLNTVVTPGEYYKGSNIGTLVNNPLPVTTVSLRLTVETTGTYTGAPGHIRQTIWLANNSDASYMYTRVTTNGTSATPTWTAWNRFGFNSKELGGRTNIPANADLNTYTTPGEYYVGLNSTAATLSNCPSTNAGRLTVEAGMAYDTSPLYLRQTYTEYSGYIFTRASKNTGGTWTTWQKYIPADIICQKSIYTTSTDTKIVYNTEFVTENSTSSKIIVYPNLKIALLRLSFKFNAVTSGGWRQIATLPVTSSTTQNFTGIIGVSVGGTFENATIVDMTFTTASGKGAFNVWFSAAAEGKRCDVNVVLSIN